MHRLIATAIAVATFALSCADRGPTAPETPAAAKETAQDIDQASSCEIASQSEYNIELVFVSSFTSAQKVTIRRAAKRLEQAIVGDLPDYDFTDAPYSLHLHTLGRTITTADRVDDLRVFVGKKQLAGFSALATPAAVRWPSEGGLPLFGEVVFNTDDLAQVSRNGWLFGLALHELSHVLGLGTITARDGVDLLACPKSASAHFTGIAARLAFFGIGGTAHASPAVPTEKDGAHWRTSVFGDELMSLDWVAPYAFPLSAVTLGALSDLGYEVRPEAADPYQLPDAVAAKTMSAQPFCGVTSPLQFRPRQR